MRRRVVACVLGLGVVVAGVYGTVALGLVGADPSPLILRGQRVDPTSFSLSGLRAPDERELVESTRLELIKSCMRDRGFDYPPAAPAEASTPESVAYAAALTGYDGRRPVPRMVSLPGGERFPVAASWTPESCMYKADSALAGDPFYREALRLKVDVLRATADAKLRSDEAAKSVAEKAQAECPSRGVTLDDLLAAIEPAPAKTPPGGRVAETRECLSTDALDAARQLRSRFQYAVASEHPQVVAEWVRILDTEIAAAKQRRPGS